jgi:hypothetical protein
MVQAKETKSSEHKQKTGAKQQVGKNKFSDITACQPAFEMVAGHAFSCIRKALNHSTSFHVKHGPCGQPLTKCSSYQKQLNVWHVKSFDKFTT